MSKCWIFDFDGTLVDSEKHVRETFIKITKEIAPERINFAEKVLIGPPLEETAKEILGNLQNKYLKIFTENFIKIHDDEILKNTIPYAYSKQVLEELFKIGDKIAIATNKRKKPTNKIINHFGWNEFFLNIECSDSETKPRNKSEMIEDLFTKDIDFKKAFFVGDTLGDASAAASKNLRFIKANYGYGRNQDWRLFKIHKEIKKIEDLI
jgi:phosphoglycolate phosphatase